MAGEARERREPNDAERRVWEHYTFVLDLVSRMALAVEEDQLHYFEDKVGQLRGAVDKLFRSLTPATMREIRPTALRQLVRWRHTQRFRAGELLHPVAGHKSVALVALVAELRQWSSVEIVPVGDGWHVRARRTGDMDWLVGDGEDLAAVLVGMRRR